MDNPQTPAGADRSQAPATAARIHRPFSVTLLVLGVLIITAINLVRFILGIKDWSFLAERPGVSPLYITLTGIIWTLTGSYLLWGLWRGKTWAPRLMQAVALTYALYYWLEVVLLENRPVSGALRALSLPVNWPFAAGVTVVSLAYTAWTLNRRKVKAYFNQDESGSLNQHTPVDNGGQKLH